MLQSLDTAILMGADRQYARKRPGLAWHVVAFRTRGLNTWWETLCGRLAVDPVVDVLPWNEPSCESCLRIQRRTDDPGGTPDEQAAMTDQAPEDDGSTPVETVP